MANRDAELGPVDLEELPRVPGHVEAILARIQLVLGLESLDLAAGVEDERRNLPARVGEALRSEDRGDPVGARPLRDGLQHALFVCAIERRDFEVLPSQAGEIGFRETDDRRALRGRLGLELLDLGQTLIECRRDGR